MTPGHTLHGMSWIVPPPRPTPREVLREIGLLIAAHAVVVLAILLVLRAVVPAVPM